MIEIHDKELLKKFPGWQVVALTERRIEMESLSSISHDDGPKIIAYLYELIPNKKWIFHLENDRFVAEIKEKSKYNRMYTSGCFDIFKWPK